MALSSSGPVACATGPGGGAPGSLEASGAGARRAQPVDRGPPRQDATCRRHLLEVARGQVFVDGERVHPAAGRVRILVQPTWRSDGCAVAWVERGQNETRLVVIPRIGAAAPALPWQLPLVSRADRVFWAGATRVVVGPHVLAPRAVASWTETVR